jgi:peptidyl-prolyl cis-trans isomerase C
MPGKKAWILAVVLFVFAGCTQEKGEEVEAPSDGAAVVAEPGKPLAEGVLGEVNGIPVTEEEFLRMIGPYPERMKENLQGREYVFNALVDHILLEGEAKRLGLDRNPDFMRKVESYRRNLLSNLLFEELNKGKFEVTLEEAQAYFDSHPDEFDRPERVHVRHILLASQEEAQKLLKEIRAGASFDQKARELSIDASTRNRGGDLGPFSKKQRPELAEAAFSLKKPDQVKGPVETKRGFHLLQLVRRIPARKETFQQAQDSLQSRLRARKRQDVKKELLGRLRESAEIHLDKQMLEGLSISPSGE